MLGLTACGLVSCSPAAPPLPQEPLTHIPQVWGPLAYAPGGYTFYVPMNSSQMYLLSQSGQTVYAWTGQEDHFLTGELMPDGSVLRHLPAAYRDPVFEPFGGGCGRIQILGSDNRVRWDWTWSDSGFILHHALELMPNGHILAAGWEKIPLETALNYGIDTNIYKYPWICPEVILEIEPVGSNQANIVWTWRAWDHLIQQFDSQASNYGVVSQHPERLHLNFFNLTRTNNSLMMDWIHFNSIDYHAGLDIIAVSSHQFSELWLIDHSTTTEQAAGSSGGNYGRGGDLLARWGNPQATGTGDAGQQVLFGQHDVHWIADGLPGAGDLLIFNNGTWRDKVFLFNNYSEVLQLRLQPSNTLPYLVTASNNCLSAEITWSYTDPDSPLSWWSPMVSGAQRLPDGDTLVSAGPLRQLFITSPSGTVSWQYYTDEVMFKSYWYDTNHAGIRRLMGLPE